MIGLRRSAVLAVVATAAALLFAGPALAAPYTRTPSLSLSTGSATEGTTVIATGRDFRPGTTIHFTLHSKGYDLGSATANSQGDFDRTLTLPDGVVGSHTITASGPGFNNTASVVFTIHSASGTGGGGAGGGGGGSTGGGGGASSGGLSNTGVAVIGIGALGVVLVAGGGAMLFAGRRRRVSA